MRIKSLLPAPTVHHLARAALPVLAGLLFAANTLALTGKPPGGVAKPVKSPPTAVDDSFTVAEDSGATTLAVRSNDLKGKGPFKIASATDPANGTVAVPGSGKNLSYQPDPGYCNDGPGGQPDTFQYTLKGGSTATVSVTVTCVDEPPVAVDDAETVTEDDPATTIDVLANDTDPDGGPKSIQSTTQPTNGTVAITNSGADLTYTPDPDYCNGGSPTDDFTYTLAPGGSQATVSVTVTCVNDAPVATAGSRTTTEDTPLTLNLDVLVSDVETADADLSYEIVTAPAHGTATATTYTPDADYNGPDSFTYRVTDRGDPDNCGAPGPACDAPETSSTETVSITVDPVNDAPQASPLSASVDEDGSLAVDLAALVSDVETADGDLTYAIVTPPTHGTLTGSGGARTYTPAADFNGSDSFTYQVTDRGDPDNCSGAPCDAPETSSTETVSITVNAVNDAPVNLLPAGPVAALPETATPLTGISVADVDAATDDIQLELSVDHGTLTVDTAVLGGVGALQVVGNGTATVTITASLAQINTTLAAADGLVYQGATGFTGPDTLTVTSDDLGHNGAGGALSDTDMLAIVVGAPDAPPVAVDDAKTVAEDDPATAIDVLANDTDPDGGPKTISSASDPANGTVVLTGGSPGAHTGLTYQPAPNYCNDPPGTTPETFTYTLAPGGSTATVSVTVTCVDDPPLAVDDAQTVAEDDPATAIDVLANDTDPDGGPKTISSASDPANGTVVITGGGTGLTYQPDPNYCNDPPGTTPETFTYTLNGGSTATVSVTVTCVNDAPIADDETFDGDNGAIGNTTLVVNDPSDGPPSAAGPSKTISGDILAGDADVDDPGPLTITPGTFATNDGGSVTVEADGDFVFQPAAATSCTDTSDFFDYTVSDQNPGTAATDTGRVTIAIAGCVWYVSNNAAGNSGTSAAPFDTLAQAEAASGSNHTVFVFDGDNTSTGLGGDGYAMNAGERLIGEHEGLEVDPDGGGSLGTETLHPANPGARPTLTASNADVIDLDDGNELRGLNIDPSGVGGGIAGGAGDTGGSTIDDVNIVDTGTAGIQPGLELSGTTGTHNITGFSYDNTGVPSSASAVSLANAGTVDFGSTSITKVGAKGLDAGTTNMGTSTFDQITVTGSNSGGVSMSTTTGTTALGDGTGTDLSLTTTGGAQPALALANAGTVSVPGAGSSNLSATGGPALDVTGTSGATLEFDDVDSTNSISDGVNIAGLGAGTFTANSSSSITNASQIAFDLDGGSGDITYDGTITDDVGQLVRIANTTGGTKDFNGQISDGNDGDGSGIALTNNTGATVNFDGGITLSTGAANAFAATGGGTVNVTDPNAVGTAPDNTIATTTGPALNVTNTTIGTSDLTFRSISANGGANGIVLNNIGNANGQLVVSGNGGSCTSAVSCSGGAIQNSTATGISLTNVPGGASLTRVFVNDSADDGIGGSSVNGLTLDNATVTSNGDTAASGGVHGDHGVDFTDLTGTVALTSSSVSNNIDSNVVVSNNSGTLNLAVNGGTYSGATGGMGDGIFVEGLGTGSQNLNVQGPITFANNVGDHIQHTADADNTTDSDVTINNATMTSPPAAGGGPFCANNILGGGIVLSHGGNVVGGSNLDATVTNNNIQNSCIGAIAVGTGGSVGNQQIARVDATIQNNTIGTAGVAGSGAVQGNGIFVDSNGNSVVRTLITGNQIRQWTNRSGIALDVLDGDAEMSATIRGNVMTEPNSAFAGTTTRGMTIQLGAAQAGDSIDACLDIGHPTDAALKNQVAGTGEPPQPDIRYLHEGPNSIVQLVGYAGPASPAITDIANYLQPRNNIGGTPTVTGVATAPGAQTQNVASCPAITP